eukprot:symbB.v1.2.025028.t1/scaffold2408.1/size79997/2
MASFEERTHGLFLFGHPQLPVPLSATISESIETNVTFEGPTIVHFRIKTPLGVLRQVKTILPIEPFKQYVEARWYAEKTVPRIIACALACIGGRALEQDREVWENKVYHKKPVLVAGDGAFLEFMRWYDQFYSEKSTALYVADDNAWGSHFKGTPSQVKRFGDLNNDVAASSTERSPGRSEDSGGLAVHDTAASLSNSSRPRLSGLETLLLLKRRAPLLCQEVDGLLVELSKPMVPEAEAACCRLLSRCAESVRFAQEAVAEGAEELSDMDTESASMSFSVGLEDEEHHEASRNSEWTMSKHPLLWFFKGGRLGRLPWRVASTCRLQHFPEFVRTWNCLTTFQELLMLVAEPFSGSSEGVNKLGKPQAFLKYCHFQHVTFF